MQGGFGSVPYVAPGEAITAGIQAGQAYMMRADEEQDRKDRLAYERQREDRLDRMQQAHIDFLDRNEQDKEQRQYKKDALEALQGEASDLHAKYSAVIDQYGGDPNKVPPDVQSQFQGQFNDWNQRTMALRRSIYGNFLDDARNRATSHAKDLQAGGVDPADPQNGADLVHTLAVSTHRDPADFLKIGDEPSRVEQGIKDFHGAMSENDPQLGARAMNNLFGPQLEGGRLGLLDPTGGTVTSVGANEDRPIVPTPNGQAFHPVLSITAQHPNGYVSTQPYAPPTNGDGDDLVTTTPQKAMDYVGQLGTMQSAVSDPRIQANLRSALQNPDQQTLDAAHAYTALGSMLGKKGGGSVHTLKDADGNEQLWFVSNDGATSKQITKTTGTKPAKPATEAEYKHQALQSLIGQPKPGGGVYTAQDVAAQEGGIKPEEPFGKVNPETLHKYQREDAQDQAMLDQGMVPDSLGGPGSYRPGKPEELKAWKAAVAARSAVQPPGPAGAGIGAGGASNPAPGTAAPPDKATSDLVTNLLNHAQQDPTARGKSAGQIVEAAIKRGILPPTARQLVGNAGDEPIGQPGANWGPAQPGAGTKPAAPAQTGGGGIFQGHGATASF